MITGNEPAMPAKLDVYDDRLGDITRNSEGLTISQQFAAMAMQGILAHTWGAVLPNGERSPHPNDIANYAVECADALINELNKQSNGNGQTKM